MFKLDLEKAEESKIKLPSSTGSLKKQERMGKTRYRFKKLKDTKGTFHAKMGSINGRNGMDLTEA